MKSGFRLAVTGYVSEQAGSVASANALLLRALLERGCEVVFFSKASFVDPRPVTGGHPGFRFVNVDNRWTGALHTRLARVPLLGLAARMADSGRYHHCLLQAMREEHARQPFDGVVWLGEYARGRIPGVASISYAQGPPGTDARSILDRFGEIRAVAGTARAWKWRLLAWLRLSRIGLPPFRFSDRIIIGSTQSRRTLHQLYRVPEEAIATLPYPIDLDLFQPLPRPPRGPEEPFRALWLGRVVPRKRLDLFLDGAALAIRNGLPLRLTLVGGIGFIPGYERLIAAFPYPDRLEWIPHLPREEVPALLARHDCLVQPSDEENFGSSVAEAQACGVPVILGATNGNADYRCERDIHLNDDCPETLARALTHLAAVTVHGGREAALSRSVAERAFALDAVADQLLDLVNETILHA